jgi:hypothetical protein
MIKIFVAGLLVLILFISLRGFMKITINIKGKDIILFLWMVATLILTISIVGMFIFVPNVNNHNRSTWMQLGKDLSLSITNEKKCFLLSFFWVIFTIFLTCTLIGMFLFIPPESYANRKATWMEIGSHLLNSIKK